MNFKISAVKFKENGINLILHKNRAGNKFQVDSFNLKYSVIDSINNQILNVYFVICSLCNNMAWNVTVNEVEAPFPSDTYDLYVCETFEICALLLYPSL